MAFALSGNNYSFQNDYSFLYLIKSTLDIVLNLKITEQLIALSTIIRTKHMSVMKVLIKVIGFFHHSADPANIVRHSCVNSKFPSFSTSFAKTGNAKNGPGPIGSSRILAQKRTSAISRARIHFPATISGAKHVIGDSVVYINISTCFWRYYRYLKWKIEWKVR